MTHVVYGFWDGEVHDNRGKPPGGGSVGDELRGFDAFNEGNPIRAFFGDRGFFVFDPKVSLIDTFWRYMDKAAEQSCGKCTPCRMGTLLVRDSLDAMRHGRAGTIDLDGIATLARQMNETSLCGLGQTCGRALSAALEHFRDVLEAEVAHGAVFRAIRHVLHDGAVHRGLPVEGQRAALHRLHPRRQAGILARRDPAEISDGGHLWPRLRAVLRNGVPAQSGGPSGRHQDAEALRRRTADRPAGPAIHPRHGGPAAQPRHARGGDRRRPGRHVLRLPFAVARLSCRCARGDGRGRRHGRHRHSQLPVAEGRAARSSRTS